MNIVAQDFADHGVASAIRQSIEEASSKGFNEDVFHSVTRFHDYCFIVRLNGSHVGFR